MLKAASIEVSDLASAEGVLGKLQLQGITDGKVAALSASGITIQDGAEAATRIASADAADLDLDGLVALLGQGSEKGGEVRRLLAGNIVLRDIATGKSGDQGDHVGSIELKGWQASTALPTCSDDEGCFAAALARMAVEALVVTDMDLQSTDDEHDAADGQVQLGRLALERFDAGKIGLFDMTDSGFVSNVDGSSFGIRHLKTENADLSALLQAQSADHASNDVERDLRQVRISNALLEDFSYRGTPDGLPFTIARIEASNNYGADDAVQTRLAVRHLIVPMPTSEQPQIMDLPPMAAAIIGAQADLAVDLDYSFEPSKQALDIERLRVALNDAGALTLKTRLEGLDMSDDTGGLVDNPVMDGLTLLQRARLTDAVLRFDNQTLVDRIIERAATDNGIKPDEVRLGIRQQLPVLAQLMPWQTDVVDQMEAFLAKPQVLTLTLRPSQPVTLIDLAAGVMSGGLDELQPTLKAN
ncbi:hypothetical protein [Arboricoccus pini]|uniref:hypothetical protein n=1 Tax=Arboricoccus pini TaxID=1963835 RepID=UPI001056DAD0|nr:hypothetical protein [Arboricoccus pini]